MSSELELHAGQETVLTAPERFVAAMAGVQSGKTTVGALWLLQTIWKAHLEGRHGDWLVAAPTSKQLEQSTLVKLNEWFPPDWGTWKQAKSRYELAFGGQIFVRSTEKPDWLEGMTLLGAWLDEAGNMKEQAWINVQARLSIAQGPCRLTTTPYSIGWLQRAIKAGVIRCVTWASNENPAFPKEEWDRAKGSLPDAIFRMRYCGESVRLEGLVYDFDYDRDVVEPFDVPGSWKRVAGLDFGQSVATAIVCLAEDPNSHVFYAYREFFREESLLRHVSDFLLAEMPELVWADPQGAQNIAELNRYYGLGNVRPAQNNVQLGIERVGTLLKEGRLKFMRGRCPHLVEELEEYRWRPEHGGVESPKDAPVKRNDHACDALRYALSSPQAARSIYPTRDNTMIRTSRAGIKARLANRNIPDGGYL